MSIAVCQIRLLILVESSSAKTLWVEFVVLAKGPCGDIALCIVTASRKTPHTRAGPVHSVRAQLVAFVHKCLKTWSMQWLPVGGILKQSAQTRFCTCSIGGLIVPQVRRLVPGARRRQDVSGLAWWKCSSTWPRPAVLFQPILNTVVKFPRASAFIAIAFTWLCPTQAVLASET